MQTITAPAATFDGLPVSTRIGPDQIAAFPIVIPGGMARLQVRFAQTGDATDRTHRNAWFSKTPGYNTPVEARPNRPMAPDGNYPEGAPFARDTQSGSLEVVVDGGSSMEVANHGSRIVAHVAVGETWYLNVANNYGRAKHPSGDANVTVWASPIN
jgi:hypothetical protein